MFRAHECFSMCLGRRPPNGYGPRYYAWIPLNNLYDDAETAAISSAI